MAVINPLPAIEKGFEMFKALLDLIPNFDQRKKTEFYHALVNYYNARKEFNDYTIQPKEQQINEVILGLQGLVDAKLCIVSALKAAYFEEIIGGIKDGSLKIHGAKDA